MSFTNFLIIFFSALLFVSMAQAQPYVPASNQDVIEVFSISSDMKLINELREKLLLNKNNYLVLDEVITLYLKIGREKSDPRYFGYAQALLEPYLFAKNTQLNNQISKNVPGNIIIHWADILQHRHDFKQALQVLDKLAAKQTQNPRVYLMRAISHISRADYAKALDNCKALIARASHLLSVSCVAQVKSLTGKLEESFKLLHATLQLNQKSEPEEKRWAISLLADMAVRNGQIDLAEKYYKENLQLKSNDYFVLANYADLLLKEKHYERVITLLETYTYVDSLLIRLAIAMEKTGNDLSDKYKNQLAASYRLIELRKEKSHLRDQARFYFDILNDSEKAMTLAMQNWNIQKEPADARLLLSIAIAVNDRSQINKIKSWAEKHSLQDDEFQASINKAKLL